MPSELDILKPDLKDISWMFAPVEKRLSLGYEGQQVIATVGCPGSGKSTFSLGLDPTKWMTLTLDDFRTALWPPHRRVYWDVRATDRGKDAQAALRNTYKGALEAGLENGWNLFLADTHIKPDAFVDYVDLIRSYGVPITWKIFKTPVETIMERNKTRPVDHRLPDEVLSALCAEMWREDAWWKSIPEGQYEIVE